MPNQSFERYAAKARWPSTLRWAIKGEAMKVGDKYSFQIDGIHPDPIFIVCNIEILKGIDVVNIYIDGLNFQNPNSPTEIIHTISHAPAEKCTLEKSNITLLDSNVPLPDYNEGYNVWKEAYDNGKAGYFKSSPSKIVSDLLGVWFSN
jgi:hypothetical protein